MYGLNGVYEVCGGGVVCVYSAVLSKYYGCWVMGVGISSGASCS